MKSVLRSVQKRKKTKRLGKIEIVDREAYEGLELDTKVELIRALIPLGLMNIYTLLDQEVTTLAGPRHVRKAGHYAGMRHGSNPASVRLGGQRLAISVPRVRSARGEIPLSTYRAFHDGGALDETRLRRVRYGISCRNYEAAADAIPGALGLSSSSVSRTFIKASAAKLKRFQEQDFSGEAVVALILDGKTFADATMVVALGITVSGEKRFLGFIETNTENTKVLSPFLRSLIERGLDTSRGLLVVIDGAKGLCSAVKRAFGGHALVQRCQWHKRENVVSYLAKREQPLWRKRLQHAYDRPTYQAARAALAALHQELDQRNQSAAASLAEGLEETLTLHRLGVYGFVGRSLKTTNCLESVNALIEERCGKVDAWKNSNQRQRWLATALLDIEPRLNSIQGFKHLPMIRQALIRELNINTTGDESQHAA